MNPVDVRIGSTASPPRWTRGLVTIILPAKDEAEGIGATIDALPREALLEMGYETELLVLDGNSRDGTDEIARRRGARVIRDAEPGKGAAVRHARGSFHGDLVVMIDADGSYDPEAILGVVERLGRGDADVVMGVRRLVPGAMSRTHRVGNRMLSFAASVLYGRRCRDLCTGLWGFRREALQGLPLRSRGFELEAEMFAMTRRLGLRIVEAPVDYFPRKGEAKLATGRDGSRILWCLLRSRFVSFDDRRRLQRPTPLREPPMMFEVIE